LTQVELTSSDCESCNQCELKANLWKCLTCGTLSCGRRQFDGSGGNGHALEHFKVTGHALAVKLGTISVKADGLEADVYCYSCDEMVIDPELNHNLSFLGIDTMASRKTEKSTAELNLEVNLTHSYSMTDASGSELKELNGPWQRGFTNLGNSCYLASVIQALRNLNKEAFLAQNHNYLTCSNSRAGDCISCQLRKIYAGLASEENSILRPWMMKRVAAGNSADFNSGRQQDASEFLTYLLQNRFKRVPELADLTKEFEIQLEEVLVCGGCGNRRASCSSESLLILSTPEERETCNLDELLQSRFSPESVDWCCDNCKKNQKGTKKQSKIVALPNYLVIVANRLKLKNWVPEKTECHIRGMDEAFHLKQFCGFKSGETSKLAGITADPVLLGELLIMGIDEDTGRAALIACKNSSVDAAINLIFEGGATASDPIEPSGPSTESIETLMAAGFTETKAKQALEATGGDLERAFDWIFSHPEEPQQPASSGTLSSGNFDSKYELNSFITHKGSSVYCGHYVVHLKNEQNKWVLYNDEKVAESEMDESFPIEDAYIYIYKKM
jgi:ubiquitin carboxyl-terminal hydrolase 5/13